VLKVARSDPDNMVVSWPAASSGFTLQQATNFVSPAWLDVAQAPTGDGSNFRVTLLVTNPRQFFRLRP